MTIGEPDLDLDELEEQANNGDLVITQILSLIAALRSARERGERLERALRGCVTAGCITSACPRCRDVIDALKTEPAK